MPLTFELGLQVYYLMLKFMTQVAPWPPKVQRHILSESGTSESVSQYLPQVFAPFDTLYLV